MKAARFLAVPVFVILLGAVMLLSSGFERAAYEVAGGGGSEAAPLRSPG